jgi:hypothetical protein
MSGGATLPLGIDAGMASSKAVFAALERWVAYEPDLEPDPAMAPGYDERYPDFLELNRATRAVVHRLARRSTRDRNQAVRTSSPSAQAPEGV